VSPSTSRPVLAIFHLPSVAWIRFGTCMGGSGSRSAATMIGMQTGTHRGPEEGSFSWHSRRVAETVAGKLLLDKQKSERQFPRPRPGD
jgi:hypothetical protein